MHTTKLKLSRQYGRIAATLFTGITITWIILQFYGPTDRDYDYKDDYDFDTGWIQALALPQRKLSNIAPSKRSSINLQRLHHVNIVNLTTPLPAYFFSECIRTQTDPNFTICVYESYEDIYISAALRSDGVWEPYITPLFKKALSNFPNAMVIDIGANIGYYTLLAAAAGRDVVAVEPVIRNTHHIHKAVKANKFEGRITLLQNALFDSVMNVTLTYSPDNQGGIWIRSWMDGSVNDATGEPQVRTTTLDHLVQVATATKAILKVDIGE